MAEQEQSSTTSSDTDRLSWLYPSSWIPQWCPTSMNQLAEVEQKIFQRLKQTFVGKYVTLPKSQNRIWTVVANEALMNTKATPVVLVHGMGGGIGLWAPILDDLARNRPLYAFDLLGFGRSSRPHFSKNSHIAEMEFVDSIEEWRKEMNIDKFIVLGHSLGGYLACSYAIKHPNRIKHIVMAEPWGMPEQLPERQRTGPPIWIKAIATMLSPFNPLAAVRVAGPWGPGLVRRFRPDLQRIFSSVLEDDIIFEYIYHCNAQTPSGETAFKTMNKSFGWAKNPMIQRVTDLQPQIPMTIVYGSRSWMDSGTGYQVKYLRNESYVDVQVIRGAGHHVYAEKPQPFNSLVLKVCYLCDSDSNFLPNQISPKRRLVNRSESAGTSSPVNRTDSETETGMPSQL